MAEVGISIAAKIAEYLVDPVLRHGKYLFCAGKVSREAESSKKKLTSTWERVQKRVEDTHKVAEEVDDAVERWLNDVKSVIEEVVNLEQEMNEGSIFCAGSCPTLKGYHLCKQLSKKTITMAELTQNSEFNTFSNRATILDVEYFPSGDFMYFTSTKLASQQLLEALQDDSIYVIGLYGMGGCGKTTLVKEVGKEAKLEDIGIPLDNHHKVCKVLLTTRRLRVCNDMNCQSKILLDLLSEEEASILFQKKANIVDDPSTILLNGVQRDVARECNGLPIAIVAVATSLKGEPLDVWKVALHDLRAPKPIDMDEGLWSKVNVAIKDLTDSSLLIYSENYNGEKCLKMHDMFRDMALWIASEGSSTIMVDPTKDLTALSIDNSMKDCYALSFWRNHMHPFPQQLNAPKLGFLLINSRDKLDLSYASFEGIKELKVMAVIGNIYFQGLLVLPQTIQWFNNLQTLRLVGRDIRDISFVVSLKSLKILDLQRRIFRALPIGIENLNELKLLDLSFCVIEEDCYEVIGRCSQLEGLYLLGAIRLPYEFFLNDVPLLEFQRYQLDIGESSLYESEVYNGMKVLFLNGMDISNLGASIKALLQRANSVKLKELMEGLKSFIPEMVQTVGSMKELTALSLYSASTIEYTIDTTTSNYDNSFPADADFPIVDNIFPMSVAQSLLLLEYLKVDSCWKLKHITIEERQNGTDAIKEEIFPSLKLFSVRNCCELECIFSRECNLCNLKSLTISNCAKLTAIFLISVAQSLLLLEYVVVDSCRKLKHIIEERQNGSDAAEEEIFPNLEYFSIKNCCELEYIFPVECNLCNLKSLTISGCAKLMTLFPMSVALSLLLLEKLELVNIWPENFRFRWPSSIELSCTDCNKLTALCEYSMVGIRCCHSVSQSSNDVSAHCEKIETLKLNNLFELSFIWMDSPQILSLRYLKELEVKGCRRLKSIFSTAISKSLLELTTLVISDCGKLEEIMAENEEARNLSNSQLLATTDGEVSSEASYLQLDLTTEEEQKKIITSNVQRLELNDFPDIMFIWKGPSLINFQNLVSLKVFGCSKMKSIFSDAIITSLPRLQELSIDDCDELKEIVSSSAQGGKCHCDFSPKSCPKQVCFPKMARVKVRSCNKIKFLFLLYIAEHLQRLESLDISEASQFEYVFSCGRETHDHNGDNQLATMLPSLTDLLISRLPRFDCVVCGGFQYQLYFPSLEEKYRHHLLPPRKAHNPGDEYDGYPMKMHSHFMGDGNDGHSMKMDPDFMGDGNDDHSMKMDSDFMGNGYDGDSMKMDSDFMGDGNDDHSMKMDSDFMGNGYDGYSEMMDSDFMGDG
ncbi:hypothetical protein L6164_008589 [Bauhinia variegata]|uniref:Uncharacterized protein n=1 Tax=Bauhinia variegata TaxID=167791 RepID=A0ACB9PIB8_BAUVA|nr:hypothetical protein L6164_008589 [Bauhinia variegata]